MLDSTAVFESRAVEIGIEPQELDEIRTRKWNTFGTFAFACGYSPGGPDEARLLQLAAKVTRAEPLIRMKLVCPLSGVSTSKRTRCVQRT